MSDSLTFTHSLPTAINATTTVIFVTFACCCDCGWVCCLHCMSNLYVREMHVVVHLIRQYICMYVCIMCTCCSIVNSHHIFVLTHLHDTNDGILTILHKMLVHMTDIWVVALFFVNNIDGDSSKPYLTYNRIHVCVRKSLCNYMSWHNFIQLTHELYFDICPATKLYAILFHFPLSLIYKQCVYALECWKFSMQVSIGM